MEVTQSVSGFFSPYDYEDITVDATAGGKGLNQNKIGSLGSQAGREQGPARLVVITSETADIRYAFDGVLIPPVAGGPGHLLPAGSIMTLASRQIMKQIRFIRDTATSATLRVTYMR